MTDDPFMNRSILCSLSCDDGAVVQLPILDCERHGRDGELSNKEWL